MNRKLLISCMCCGLWGIASGAESVGQVVSPSSGVAPVGCDYIVLPSETNVVRFRIYTNAAPDAPRLFNAFDMEAFGQQLLQAPRREKQRQGRAGLPCDAWLNSVLVNGVGPALSARNGVVVIGRSAGPDWCYTALDVTAGYRDRLREFKRSILFVQPDLFILYDHLVAREPSTFQEVLHPPAATRIDHVWRALRLEFPAAGLTIHTPSFRKHPQHWNRVESPADKLMPNTVTMQLGPTENLTDLDWLTVFAVHPGEEKRQWAFKLLQSPTAIGVRVFRDGLPILVAFKTDLSAERTGLAGFEFTGPVGVYAYNPSVNLYHRDASAANRPR